MNQVWVELALIAHDLIRWTQTLLLEGELAKAEPKRLRYRLLHIAARLAFHGRTAMLRLQANWPWGQSSSTHSPSSRFPATRPDRATPARAYTRVTDRATTPNQHPTTTIEDPPPPNLHASRKIEVNAKGDEIR
jgi:hypothetical protein